MEKCNRYLPVVNTKKSWTITDEEWDKALEHYRKEEYEKIVPTLISYINKDLEKYKTNTGYSIPHGSVILNIILTDKEFKVECPFINIAEAKKVPLMRKLLELRLDMLDLATITLKEDNAVFEFSCPLELCEPYKIYAVLKEICLSADRYDDEFIEKFDAKNIQEPKIEQIPLPVKEEIHTKVQELIDDNVARLDYYVSKRDGRKVWCTLNIALKQLEYYAQPQGYLRTELENAIDLIYSDDINFHDMVLKSKENLLKIRNYDKEKFLENLYNIEVFVPYKYSGKKENIRDNWSDRYDDVIELMNNNNHEAACIEMLSAFYDLYYYNLVNKEISKPIEKAMSEASGKKWSEAAEYLFKGMRKIMEDEDDEDDFGMDISNMMNEQMKASMSMFKKMMSGFSN